MFNSKLQLYSHVDSFTSYSRVALPGPSESVYRDPHRPQRIRLAPAAWTATHATPHDFSTADCWNCISLHTLAVQSAFVGRATAIPGLTRDCAPPCAVFARSSDGRAAARRTNVVRCASTVVSTSTSCWDLGGAVSHFVSSENSREQSSIKVPAADAPTMSMIYVARPRRSPITNY